MRASSPSILFVNALKMSPAAAATRLISPCYRRPGQCIQKSFKAPSIICQARAVSGTSISRMLLTSRTTLSPLIGKQRHFIEHRGILESRRKFSVTSIARHGHLDPPKPGEECVCPTSLRITGIDLYAGYTSLSSIKRVTSTHSQCRREIIC